MNKKLLFSTALLLLFSSTAFTQNNEELLTVNDVNSNLTTYASSEEITHNGIIFSLDNEKMEATVIGVYLTDDNFEYEVDDSYYREEVLVLFNNIPHNGNNYKLTCVKEGALTRTDVTTILSNTESMIIEKRAFALCEELNYVSLIGESTPKSRSAFFS